MLEKAYQYPVDIEFTVNFSEGKYRINLLQQAGRSRCGGRRTPLCPKSKPGAVERIVEAHGAIIGTSRLLRLDRFIYVVPRLYGRLPSKDRYEIARLLGRINRASPERGDQDHAPRAGTMGHRSALTSGSSCIFPRSASLRPLRDRHDGENLIPDVSLGTHFLNELVETDILYM